MIYIFLFFDLKAFVYRVIYTVERKRRKNVRTMDFRLYLSRNNYCMEWIKQYFFLLKCDCFFFFWDLNEGELILCIMQIWIMASHSARWASFSLLWAISLYLQYASPICVFLSIRIRRYVKFLVIESKNVLMYRFIKWAKDRFVFRFWWQCIVIYIRNNCHCFCWCTHQSHKNDLESKGYRGYRIIMHLKKFAQQCSFYFHVYERVFVTHYLQIKH